MEKAETIDTAMPEEMIKKTAGYRLWGAGED